MLFLKNIYLALFLSANSIYETICLNSFVYIIKNKVSYSYNLLTLFKFDY